MGYIYSITHIDSGKKYVGQTTQSDVNKRWTQHKNYNSKSTGICLSNAIKKYGADKFKFQIICICFDEDCNIYEEQYITRLNTLAPNGYNLRAGGMNSKQHPDTIKQRTESWKKTINERRAKGLPPLPPASEEQRRKQSEFMRTKMQDKIRVPITEERRSKISEAFKKIWQERRDNNTFDLYTKGHFTKGHNTSGVCPNRKKVGQYDKEGNIIATYESTVEAGRKNNITYQSISCVCRGAGGYKSAGGYIWKFL